MRLQLTRTPRYRCSLFLVRMHYMARITPPCYTPNWVSIPLYQLRAFFGINSVFWLYDRGRCAVWLDLNTVESHKCTKCCLIIQNSICFVCYNRIVIVAFILIYDWKFTYFYGIIKVQQRRDRWKYTPIGHDVKISSSCNDVGVSWRKARPGCMGCFCFYHL